MERRGFFKSIAGLFILANANPVQALDPSFYSRRPEALLDIQPQVIPLNEQLKMLTQMIHGKISQQITWPTKVVTASRIGEAGLCHQYGIDILLRAEDIERLSDQDIESRYVDPMVARLFAELETVRPAEFGQLQLPSGIDFAARVEDEKFAIRGLRMFDMGYGYQDSWGTWHGSEPGYITRFDVLFS